MIEINYPDPSFKIKQDGGKSFLFDEIRKIWLLLTEEEWVRQNFVSYLIQQLQYPSSLIALEKELVLNSLKKRFDVLVYNRNHKPWMLVECKAPNILLDDAALQQVLRYNISIPVSYLVITNGKQTYGWEKTGSGVEQLLQLPLMED
jgi:hypothetical protein